MPFPTPLSTLSPEETVRPLPKEPFILKVLVADDNPSYRLALEKLLGKWGYKVVSAGDGHQALAILQSVDPPRLAVLDWMMPGMDGSEVCRRIRELNREPYIYILLVTAKDTPEELVEGMESGADDYLSKPVNSHELRVRVRAGRRILDLQEELMHAREALRRQATRDPLTELWNRAAMLEILSRELKRTARESGSLSLIMADLDHFKNVNDTLGHAAGDAVLREAARRIAQCVRPYDSPCRYGGEEFLIVLPGCDLAGAAMRAEQIRSAIDSTPFQIPEGTLDITCSLGIASTAPGAASTAQCPFLDAPMLIQQADEALYRAKNNGRNRVEAPASQALVLTH